MQSKSLHYICNFNEFSNFVLFFSTCFYAKTWWTIQKSGNFYLCYFNSSDLDFWSKIFFCSFWFIFYPLDPDPWIYIFLRIRIQEANIWRIQRIRILSTGPPLTIYWLWLLLIYNGGCKKMCSGNAVKLCPTPRY